MSHTLLGKILRRAFPKYSFLLNILKPFWIYTHDIGCHISNRNHRKQGLVTKRPTGTAGQVTFSETWLYLNHTLKGAMFWFYHVYIRIILNISFLIWINRVRTNHHVLFDRFQVEGRTGKSNHCHLHLKLSY